MIKLDQAYTEDDLNLLIQNAVEEGQQLDYKRSDALSSPAQPAKSSKLKNWKLELCKDVSAMANANGGVLIYGIDEQQDHNGQIVKIRPQGFDGGVNPNTLSKETLVRVINDGIQRRPEYYIDKVELTSYSGMVAYVIRIPQSRIGAHQVITDKDNRYYQRHETEVLRMQDWEIRDVMGRPTAPDLDINFRLSLPTPDKRWTSTEQRQRREFWIQMPIVNYGITEAEYAIVSVLLDGRLDAQFPHNHGLDYRYYPEVNYQAQEGDSVFRYSKYVFSITPKIPIFGKDEYHFLWTPTRERDDWQIKFSNSDFNQNRQQNYIIRWEIQTPGMVPKYGLESITYSITTDNLTHATLKKGVLID